MRLPIKTKPGLSSKSVLFQYRESKLEILEMSKHNKVRKLRGSQHDFLMFKGKVLGENASRSSQVLLLLERSTLAAHLSICKKRREVRRFYWWNRTWGPRFLELGNLRQIGLAYRRSGIRALRMWGVQAALLAAASVYSATSDFFFLVSGHHKLTKKLAIQMPTPPSWRNPSSSQMIHLMLI